MIFLHVAQGKKKVRWDKREVKLFKFLDQRAVHKHILCSFHNTIFVLIFSDWWQDSVNAALPYTDSPPLYVVLQEEQGGPALPLWLNPRELLLYL